MIDTTNIDLGTARALADHCAAHAREIAVPMTVSIVDAAGHLVLVHRMDNANWLSPGLAQGKAMAAAAMRMPTAALGARWKDFPALSTAATVISHGHFVPLPGGFPLWKDGQVVGAIGASGGTGAQDAEVCLAGIERSAAFDERTHGDARPT